MGETTNLPPPARSTLRLLLVFIVLAVGVVAAIGLWLGRQQKAALQDERGTRQAVVAAGLPIEVAEAQGHSGPRTVTLPGDVRAYRQVTLYSKVSGYLEKILVDKGDAVHEGQQLAVVKSPESDQIVKSLKASLAAKAQLVRRYRPLVDRGVVSGQEMDKATADLQSSQAELKRYEALRDYEVISAPYDGVITARYVDAGALISAASGSTESAQPLVDLADTKTVRIYFYVGQAEASFVHEGDRVALSGDEDVPLQLTAPISRLAHALDVRTRTMLAEVDLDNAAGNLVPGLFVHVTLHVQGTSALTLPSQAVIIRDGVYYVAKVGADRRVHLVPVQLGADDGHVVHVLSGLAAGDWVGLGVGDELDDGMAVQPMHAGRPVDPADLAAPGRTAEAKPN